MLEDSNPEERILNVSDGDRVGSDIHPNGGVDAEQLKATNNVWVDLRYRGVGGWLMFFIVTLVFIGPLRICASLVQYHTNAEPLYADYPFLKVINVFYVIVGFGLICFSIYAGYSLWKVRPKVVQTAKTYLLVSAICWTILTCSPLLAGLPKESNTAMLLALPLEILKQLVYPTVWYLYLTNSKRVAATYALLPQPAAPIT
ncbi:MAG: DUF2569 family protein [Pyrinomonadaceae bacterium]